MSTAKIDIKADDRVYGVTMFSPVIEEICKGGEASKVGLLSAKFYSEQQEHSIIYNSVRNGCFHCHTFYVCVYI